MAKQTCDHAPCNCSATAGERFCSDACRDLAIASPHSDTRCGCDHEACVEHSTPPT
jgi:hypothetical protein